MSASQSGVFSLQEFTDGGVLLVGGRLYTYTSGTTTFKTAYTDAAGLVPQTYTSDGGGGQYIALNARGELPAPLYLTTGSYDITLKRADGTTVWTRQADPTGDAPAAVSSSILASFASSLGATLLGLIRTASGAVARTLQTWLDDQDFTPQDFGAVKTGGVYPSSAIQAAIDATATKGGGSVYLPPGTYSGTLPLRLPNTVSLRGPRWFGSATILKTSSATSNFTIIAGALVVYNNAVLPSALNSIIVLDSNAGDGRYTGCISDVTLQGALGTPGLIETALVEFGIVSIGSVSDYTRTRVKILNTQYSEIYPVIFDSTLTGTRLESCWRGPAIDTGTSITYHGNYANNCRDWGHYIRGVLYSSITGNACDNLNDPTKYATRTRTCAAYRLRSLIGCTVTSNGDEQTYGRSIELTSFDHSTLTGHVSVGIGSDYVGVDQIAWIYSTNTMRGSSVYGNFAYSVKASGLLSGGAVAGQHHNIYFEGQTFVIADRFDGNLVASASSNTVEAGWGNNVPTNWPNATAMNGLTYGYDATAYHPTLQAQTSNDVVFARGADDAHFVKEDGVMREVWGCFHGTVTYTTGTGFLIASGFPTNGAKSAGIQIVASLPVSGTMPNRPAVIEMSAAQAAGVTYSTTGANFTITNIPSGSTVRFHYRGKYSTV